MHTSHAKLEQELFDLTIHAAATATSTPTTTLDRPLGLAVSHASHIATILKPFVKPTYPYALFLAFLTMTSFFVTWALWEKMTFCLGLAIIVAIMLGFAKNIYSRWCLRHYSTVEDPLLTPTPAMVEARLGHRIDAPFGIRALESGVEIEGVWISRTNLNTPTPSRPHSPAGSSSSSFLDEPTTPSFAIREPTRGRIQSSQSSVPSWYAPSKRGSSDAGSTASWTIDTNGFKRLDVYKPRPTSEPGLSRLHTSAHSAASAMSDSSSMDCPLARSLTTSSDDNYKPTSSSTMATSPSTSVNGSEPPKTPNDSTRKDSTQEEEHKADLGLLYTHRLSHVAETGQLVPRSKKSPRTSGEWSRTAPARPARPRHPPISMHNRGVSRSLPSTPTDESKDPFDFVVPKRNVSTANLLANGTAHADDANRLQAAKGQPVEEPEVDDMLHSEHFYHDHDGAISAIATLSKPEAAYAPPPFERERNSEVLRKVNDDFQILKPKPPPHRSISAPSSRENSQDRSKRHSRRLTKERPSTNARDRNSFIEVLYGSERQPRF